jgi:hypothetical protein
MDTLAMGGPVIALGPFEGGPQYQLAFLLLSWVCCWAMAWVYVVGRDAGAEAEARARRLF